MFGAEKMPAKIRLQGFYSFNTTTPKVPQFQEEDQGLDNKYITTSSEQSILAPTHQ